MKRHGLLLLALALCLSLCACAPKEEETGPEKEAVNLEDLLQPNDKEPFGFFDPAVNGEPVMDEDWKELPAAYFLDLFGEPSEITLLPTLYTSGWDLEKVYHFANGCQLWVSVEDDWETPGTVWNFCVAGLPETDLNGIRIGDGLEKVLDTFQIGEAQRRTREDGSEVWMLYGEERHEGTYGLIEMEEDRPTRVLYSSEGFFLVFPLDEEGKVSQLWYSRNAWLGPYPIPETLYDYDLILDYASREGAAACQGHLQGDLRKPMAGTYITQDGTAVTVRYQMPRMEAGDRFTADRTAEMQDAVLIFLASPEAETVQFVYEYPLYDYRFSETAITRDMAKEALGAPISAPADGDWSRFDRQLREVYWYPETADGVDFDRILEEAGDPLRSNGQEPLTTPLLGDTPPWKLSEDGAAALLGTPVSQEDTPVFDGAAVYRIFTYPGGSMSGGWVESGGKVESIGALYLTGDVSQTFCGIRIGDSADTVLRTFQVENARESILLEYGEERAMVLYGEVIHMGTFGYAAKGEDGRYTSIVYGAGEAGVVTFFLDGAEQVSAIRFQMEDHMRLPPEE